MEVTYALINLEFDYDEPIFFEDIAALYPNLTRQAIYKKLRCAIDDGSIERFSRGVYYRPRNTQFGKSKLSPSKIVEKKWLLDETGVCGYIAGTQLENQLGLTEQVSAELEIVTNKESARVREVEPFGGYKRIIVRRARTKITNENVDALRFLDILTTPATMKNISIGKAALKKLAGRAGKNMIFECAKSYPAKTSKRLLECELNGIFA